MARQVLIKGPTVLQVFIFREGRFWGTECFAQPAVLVGRSPDCDLQLEDDITSRNHAQISVTADGIVLEDLGSSNGTFVNGEPVQRCFVSSRDEIEIGSFTIKVKLLTKARQTARFQDETRVLQRSDLRADHTEVVEPEPVGGDMIVSGEDRAEDDMVTRAEPFPAQKKPGPDGNQALTQAIQEELESFELPSTDKLDKPPAAAVKAAEDDFEARTLVEPSPAGREAAAPEGVPAEIAGVDHSTRWLTPEPSAGPSPETSIETAQPQEPQAVPTFEQSQEPAGLQDFSSPPASAYEPSVQVSPELMERPEPPEREAGYDYQSEYDEEEDIPPDFVEPFSLLNNLIRENFAKPEVACEPVPVVEVIGYTPQEKQVMTYDQVNRGKRYRIGAEKFTLLKFDDQTSCTIQFTDEFSGGVISGGQKLPVDDLKSSNNLVKTSKGRRIYSYKLLKGDYGNLILGGQGWFVRFVNPPRLPPPKTSFQINPFTLKVFGSSFLAHVMIIVLMSFFSKPVEAVNEADIDRFAKVAMNEIKTEVEEPEAEVPLDKLPEPEEQKVEQEKPKQEEKKPEKKVKPRKTRRRARNRGSGGGGKGGSGGGGGVGMMAALGNLNKNRPSTNIVAAVSNLDAVRVPGARSRFKVSGIVTKLPTSSVVLSRGRGVGVKTGIELLRGGKGRGGRAGIGPGALGGGKTGRRGIGGVVFKAPKRRMKVTGHLSREAIAKVVRAHLREIQYCYEKNLLLNPNLKGKVVMEWTIARSGAVSVVKTKQNTMATPTVAMCISAKIRTWRFPKPKGGIVIVKYPFIFNSIGF